MRWFRIRFRRSVVIVAVVAVVVGSSAAVIVGAVQRDRACERWVSALDALTASAGGLVGSETAQQFRREAVARGWIDLGGEHIERPEGCSS